MDNPTATEYRQVPQNVDAERFVLGSILFDVTGDGAITEASGILMPQDFYQQAHQQIFQAMIELADDQRPIDPLTLSDKLSGKKQLENIGGMQYLAELANTNPTSANLVYYANIVREKSVLRRIIDKLTQNVQLAFEEDKSTAELLADLNRDIDGLAENRGDADFKDIKSVLEEARNEIENASNNDSEVTGLATGYPDLDHYTHGFKSDELIIIAARPAVGKTAFILNVALNVAKKEQQPVVIFSLEMGAVSLVNRLLASEGTIDSNHLTTGQLSNEEWASLNIAMQELAKTQIYMDDTPGIKINEIRAKLRKLEKDLLNRMSPDERIDNPHPVGMVVIDYLQLIESNNHENRQQEVSDISRSLKKLAKELHAPVLALSQLSRGVEQRQDKRPVLSDIRESGSIEQDADIVAFLYRDDYYERGNDDEDNQQDPRDQESSDIGPVEVIIEKNRSGARGTATLMFAKPFFKFSPISFRDNFDMNAGPNGPQNGW
ncbi:MAG TPA: replicative DNA helicase [Lactobacillaceae bacterium]|jgi:replicative DNA helicase